MPFFPNNGGGPVTPGNMPTPLGSAEVWVSGTGNDGNSGKDQYNAKLTLGNAWDTLAGLGGGLLHVCPNAVGPLWVRSDGLTPPVGPLSAAWHQAASIRIIPHGTTAYNFATPASVSVAVGSPPDPNDYLFYPAFWFCGGQSVRPMQIDGLTAGNGSASTQPFRFGVDFARDSVTGAPQLITCTSWARTPPASGPISVDNPGTATLALTLPAAISARVGVNFNTDSRRAGNTVILRFNSQPFGYPINVGTTITVVSTDANFPSGTYVTVDPGEGNAIKYTDAGSASAFLASSLTVQTHGISPGDRIAVRSADSRVLATHYKVRSVTDATHVVLNDYTGNGGTRPNTVTVANPGTVTRFDAFSAAIGQFYSNDLAGASPSAVSADNDLGYGPTIMWGGTTDGRTSMRNINCGGCQGGTRDPDRAAFLSCDPGGSGLAGTGLTQIIGGASGSGNIRVYGAGAVPSFYAADIEDDSFGNVAAPPVVDIINGTQFGSITCQRIRHSDNASDSPAVRIDAVSDPSLIHIDDCGWYLSGGNVTGVTVSTGVAWDNRTDSMLRYNQTGFFAGKKIAGQPVNAYRGLGMLSSAEVKNLWDDNPANWSGGIYTAGQADPFGGTGATLVTGSGGGLNQVSTISPTVTVGTGDIFIIAGMAKFSGTEPVANTLAPFFTQDGSTPLFGTTAYFKNDGAWDYFATYWVSPTNLGAISLGLGFRWFGNMTVFQPTLLRLPAGSWTENDAAEMVAAMRGRPFYLLAGMAGTAKGQKLIGHGGLGTAKRYTVGVASGNITLGGVNAKAVELFDESGNSLGVAVLQSFTVNP